LVTASTSIPLPPTFRFENAWLLNPSFLPTTLPAWSHAVPAHCAARDLAARVKRFRSAAKVWKKKNRYCPQLDNNCKFIIELFDYVEECRSLSDPERALREKACGALADSVARVAAA
jgi:hypothetical protein